MTTRDEVLGRVRNANPESAASHYSAIERNYRRASSLSVAELLAELVDRLADYGAGTWQCRQNEIGATVGKALQARAKNRLVIPEGIPGDWLPDGLEFIRDRDLSYADLDRCEGALTACTAAIAMTGSILLTHREHEGRRALTLIPDYHLCVVFGDQIAETVPEGIGRLSALSRHPITTIAGPSATADIEMIRVKGVHGPRTLDVILAI
jgi:L-lactate dehydrogenase complex protein LldG